MAWRSAVRSVRWCISTMRYPRGDQAVAAVEVRAEGRQVVGGRYRICRVVEPDSELARRCSRRSPGMGKLVSHANCGVDETILVGIASWRSKWVVKNAATNSATAHHRKCWNSVGIKLLTFPQGERAIAALELVIPVRWWCNGTILVGCRPIDHDIGQDQVIDMLGDNAGRLMANPWITTTELPESILDHGQAWIIDSWIAQANIAQHNIANPPGFFAGYEHATISCAHQVADLDVANCAQTGFRCLSRNVNRITRLKANGSLVSAVILLTTMSSYVAPS